MISNTERRFIEQWKDQKNGPKWRYYLQFTIAWTVVSFLVIFFLTKLFTPLWETGGRDLIFILIGISIITGFLSTHLTYSLSEKKYDKITKREEGKMS
jgi:amino acid transporter